MHQGYLPKILWITSSAKTQNISPTKKESLRLKTTSRREGPNLKIPTYAKLEKICPKNSIFQQLVGCNDRLNIILIKEINHNLNKQQFLGGTDQDTGYQYQIYQHGVLVTKDLIHNMQCHERREFYDSSS